MKVELLYFDGCPTHKDALNILEECVREVDPTIRIEKINVISDDRANSLEFLGSPTIKIDGRDIDEKAQGHKDFGLKCRVYESEEGFGGLPPREMILKALQRGKYHE
ncbi:MAG: DUF2703 domain-containing protein [Nitrospinota bacterium]